MLAWINNLRMICSLGTRAKNGAPCQVNRGWDAEVAQDVYNSLVVAGAAICAFCKVDLDAVSTEVADEVHGETRQPKLASCSHLFCSACLERRIVTESKCPHDPAHPMLPGSTLSSTVAMEDDSGPSKSIPTKIKTLLQDLEAHIQQEKSVVFSFWTSTLDVVEECLRQRRIGYMRFDGKVPNKQRGRLLQSFHDNAAIRVALLTIFCGAVGLDLTSVSRAYLMESHWNPSVEQQALARIYRMGKQRPVTTIRYAMRNSFENHVINVQNRKQLLTELLLTPEGGSEPAENASSLQQFRTLISAT